MTDRPPLPPFTHETAMQKVQAAEDAWNMRDPQPHDFKRMAPRNVTSVEGDTAARRLGMPVPWGTGP